MLKTMTDLSSIFARHCEDVPMAARDTMMTVIYLCSSDDQALRICSETCNDRRWKPDQKLLHRLYASFGEAERFRLVTSPIAGLLCPQNFIIWYEASLRYVGSKSPMMSELASALERFILTQPNASQPLRKYVSQMLRSNKRHIHRSGVRLIGMYSDLTRDEFQTVTRELHSRSDETTLSAIQCLTFAFMRNRKLSKCILRYCGDPNTIGFLTRLKRSHKSEKVRTWTKSLLHSIPAKLKGNWERETGT